MKMIIISFYVLGCIISLLIYDVIVYEKYNKQLFKGFNKKDILSGSFIIFSWLYIIGKLIEFKNINFNIMKILKKLGKKFWEAYKEGVEMQYKYYYTR